MNELWHANDGRSVRRQPGKAPSKSVSVRLTRVEYERIQDMIHAGLFRCGGLEGILQGAEAYIDIAVEK